LFCSRDGAKKVRRRIRRAQRPFQPICAGASLAPRGNGIVRAGACGVKKALKSIQRKLKKSARQKPTKPTCVLIYGEI
jgi:hypothetical protein